MRITYTPEMIEFMRSKKHLQRKEIARLLNEKYGTKASMKTVSLVMVRNGIRTESGGKFKKGVAPWNKGVKGYMGAGSTSFKKGHEPHNFKPIGFTRTGKDGYRIIKTEKGFIPEARYIYEKHHGVKLSKNENVIYLDGNNQNTSIENLRAVTRAENMLMAVNKFHQIPVELKDAAIQVVKLESLIFKRKRNNG